MKIVHCFYSLTVGGAEILAIDLLNRMCVDHQASLVIVNDQWSEALLKNLDPRVKVHFINRRQGSRNPLPLITLNRMLFSIRPDIVHCHEPKMGKIIRLGGAKRVYTIHDTGIPTTHYHHYEALVAISDAVQKDVVHRYHQPVATVYNGIDAQAFRKRKDYSFDGPLQLVQVSRLLHEKKGQDLLLHALAILKKDFHCNDVLLDIVGVGPSLDYLKGLSTELGLNEQVSFAGEKSRQWMHEQLCQYHLLVQPSRYEGFGLTILEGFAAGLPVVASHIEGPAEIISQTPRGKLFAYNSAEDCARCIHQMLQSYRDGSMKTMMEDTLPVTDTRYSIQNCAEGYLQVYAKAIKNEKQ